MSTSAANPLVEFFSMGGYAMYVWPAFAISFIVIVANIWFARMERKRAIASIARKVQIEKNASKT